MCDQMETKTKTVLVCCWCDEYYSPKEFKEKGVCLAGASQSQSMTEKSRVGALAGPVGGNTEECLLACSLGLLTFLSCRTEDHLSLLGLAWLTSIVQQENASQIFLQLKLMETVLQLRIFLKVSTLSQVGKKKSQTKPNNYKTPNCQRNKDFDLFI